MSAPASERELEDRLAAPGDAVVRAVAAVPGDVLVLGAGGKMGPSLARMLRCAADITGDTRRVVAVSRFSDAAAGRALEAAGVLVVRADLDDPAAVAALPETPNVILMAGQKFGTSDAPWRTWGTNVTLSALVAARFARSRILAFSSGNVYPLTPVASGGSREDASLGPSGEYAWACVGRERVLEHASRVRGTPVAIVRLNYAVDLRYGVLVDVAQHVLAGSPIDLGMGYVNVIWQGDANAQALQALALASSPPFIVNVTGTDVLSIREAALELGRLLGREPRFEGRERPDALLSDTRRAQELFAAPSVSTATLIDWVAEWLGSGGRTLGKPTHFEERGGRF
ncbi:MAG: NAD-dependent epimerase/dehydratase family protein [Gemmatimonadaceae bacterium]